MSRFLTKPLEINSRDDLVLVLIFGASDLADLGTAVPRIGAGSRAAGRASQYAIGDTAREGAEAAPCVRPAPADRLEALPDHRSHAALTGIKNDRHGATKRQGTSVEAGRTRPASSRSNWPVAALGQALARSAGKVARSAGPVARPGP
jgi:hypothetical protein